MAKEDLSTLWEDLKLTKDEEDIVKLSDQSILEVSLRGKNCLTAKLITKNFFNKEAFRSTMP